MNVVRMQRLGILVGIGLVTGYVSSQFYNLQEGLGNKLLIGAIFSGGLCVGIAIFRAAAPLRVAAFGLLGIGIFRLAEWTAANMLEIAGKIAGDDETAFLIVGGAAGLVGAALVALLAALLFDWFRRPWLWAATVVTGVLLGAVLLGLALGEQTIALLFMPWQAAIAGCLALGFPVQAATSSTESE